MWQVTLCDPIWYVSSRSGDGRLACKLLYPSLPFTFTSTTVDVNPVNSAHLLGGLVPWGIARAPCTSSGYAYELNVIMLKTDLYSAIKSEDSEALGQIVTFLSSDWSKKNCFG